jgi:hypothetical protein
MLPTVAADRQRRQAMIRIVLGSYVVHAKLPELGAGEIVAAAEGRVLIRFGFGARDFNVHSVSPHLSISADSPAKPAPVATTVKPKTPLKLLPSGV